MKPTHTAKLQLTPTQLSNLIESQEAFFNVILRENGKRINVEIPTEFTDKESESVWVKIEDKETGKGIISIPLDFITDIELIRTKPNPSNQGLQKEYFGELAQVFVKNGGRSPGKMLTFAEIAKQDFPTLKDEDITIVTFDGISKRGIMGIRFYIGGDIEVPKDYCSCKTFSQMDEVI